MLIMVKQEPLDENMESEIIEVGESMPEDEMIDEPEMAATDESLEALLTFSEEDLQRFDHRVSNRRVRRLRWAEEDDVLLLRLIFARNPFGCSVLWEKITQIVGKHTGKKFSVRSVREHTDLLMNAFSLRGCDSCLKRTPPELMEKKKLLLQRVFKMWKRDFRPPKKSTGEAAKSKDSIAEEDPLAMSPSLDPETPRSVWPPSGGTVEPPGESSGTSSISTVLPAQTIPLTLHFSGPLVSNALHPNMPHLITSTAGLKKVTLPPGFKSSLLGRAVPVPRKLLPAPTTPDLVASTISTQPLPMNTMHVSSVPTETLPGSVSVDRCTSPILSLDNSTTTSGSDSDALQNPPLNAPSVVSSESHSTERNSLHLINGRQRARSTTRARLEILKQRHRDQVALRKKELELEKRRLALEEKRLSLEERKVQLEEEKWLFDKKEREEKLLLMSDEREHKMAMERRQQSMIDILLELKNKQ